MKKWFRGREEPIAPDELRAIREEAGLTPEQFAGVVRVLPLEVTAWESGAVSVPQYEGEVMRWRVRMAAYEAALPRSGCDWTRTHAARLERLWQHGPYGARQAQRERAEHERACAECMRVQETLRSMPPPARPVEPGFWGRRPGWPALVGGCGIVYLGYKGLRWLVGAGFDASLAEFASLFGIGAWVYYLFGRLQPLEDRRPYLYGHVVAAAAALPATVAYGLLGHADLSSPRTWIVAGLISVSFGYLSGSSSMDERNELLRLNDAVPGDVERAVAAPQQALELEPSPNTGVVRADT
ncbi:MAG TPA: hypothetical protein VFQ45_04485 [Longimicrobium sp.]|nr:hypothetical protein [Longimicrobium sp.]